MDALDGAEGGGSVLDLSHLSLNSVNFETVSEKRSAETTELHLCYNRLAALPVSVSRFTSLEFLDVSNNGLLLLGAALTGLSRLRSLIAKNNRLDEGSLPKDFSSLQRLEVLNFSGNCFEEIPTQVLQLQRLHSLSFGGNRLTHIPPDIDRLTGLELLYLGGNMISSIPVELANLPVLSYLALCDNRIQSIPPQFTSLVQLQELSLRGNPLVVRFIKDMTYDPPSLLELAGRAVKTRNLCYSEQDLPADLVTYLDLASKCPNPKCGGVYFDSCVRHIKFVDFCGKYRLPLMHYLCSPECTSPCSSNPQSDADSDDDQTVPADRLQRVLLG
ncbi:leucine-rich repeat-containing protein 58 isoform X2 [Neoarius graeffei]|uniref:leucine-rich repeat-containing protein 58 isoform X2 n=1 Tax=Neoarius graeffei TaxID=443677 RepID=UPI00298BE9F4|nr:leucine-rich repeat-containing protein 58 isoform X2 [Neoarius graeffei]